jgi:hypothetical protein
MTKVAVTAQEKIEQLLADAEANADGPLIDVTQLQNYIAELDDLEAKLNEAKLTLKASMKARNERLKLVQEEITKAELTVKSHYGPKSPKTKEYVMAQPRARRPSPKV